MTETLLYTPPRSKRDTPRVDAVRAFVFTSGYRWFAEHDLADHYRDLLPAHLRDGISIITAAEWIGIDDALVIYATCDALGLSYDQQIALGRFVSSTNNGIFFNTVARLVGKIASPWTALGHLDKAWQRSNRGGAVAVYKLSERRARLEFWQVPLACSPFFTTSMRGAIAVGIEPFCGRLVVNDVAELATSDSFALRITW